MNDYSNPAVIATSLAAAAAAATVVPGYSSSTVGVAAAAATPEWFATTNTTPTTYHDMQSIGGSGGGGYEIPYHHHHPQTTVTLRYSDTLETIDAGSVSNDEKSSTSSDGMSPDNTTILMPMVKRGRPTENPCWNYFHRIDDQLVRCRICTKLVKSACATNMTKHLERHHSDDYEKLSEQIRLYRMNDASFRTKIQYLTHMNPPAAIDDSYLVPKIDEVVAYDTPPLTTSTVPLPTVPNTSAYYDYSTPADSTNWHLSHFWEMPPTVPPPPTVIQSTSSVTPTVPQVTVAPPLPQQPKRQWNGGNAAGAGGGERPYMKRNRKTEHPVWEYFKRTGDGNAECTICGGVVKSPCSSNFMRHLMRHHTPEYNDVYMKWVQKRNQTQPC